MLFCLWGFFQDLYIQTVVTLIMHNNIDFCNTQPKACERHIHRCLVPSPSLSDQARIHGQANYMAGAIVNKIGRALVNEVTHEYIGSSDGESSSTWETQTRLFRSKGFRALFQRQWPTNLALQEGNIFIGHWINPYLKLFIVPQENSSPLRRHLHGT